MIEELNSNSSNKYVDLDLPSGTKWAKMNLGASKPSDPGLYFQWGDIQGYTKDQVGFGDGQKRFSWFDYKWYLGRNIIGGDIKFTKYTNPGDVLEPEDDAAYVYMGGSWHIPTDRQIQELIDNTISTRITLVGVNGMKFTSKKDSSKFIFFPAAGGALDGSVCCRGSYGNVWSSVLNSFNIKFSHGLAFSQKRTILGYGSRYSGHPVRGVIG